ncbi:hypothetical protein ZIOFF_049431 [Zingiber officinale]|uniref:Uncharacterized protein n=1 Tax=Zingiber officinale TaxID=94328 RepID=A0A8J5G164_ZINOF|nr:hypothetical protein ZIOFF_049431 [Zingiber officinale]
MFVLEEILKSNFYEVKNKFDVAPVCFCFGNKISQLILMIQLLSANWGIKKEDLPKYEEQLELQIVKEDLKGLKKKMQSITMETQLKRSECSLT